MYLKQKIEEQKTQKKQKPDDMTLEILSCLRTEGADVSFEELRWNYLQVLMSGMGRGWGERDLGERVYFLGISREFAGNSGISLGFLGFSRDF